MTNKLTIEGYPYNKDLNGTFVPKSADIAIRISTGTWEEYGPNYNYSVTACLGVEVNDDSGEDGAAAPNLSFPPFEHTPHFTSINDLVGKKIVERWKDPMKDDYRYFWEGTFGNDLDGCLTSNTIFFKEYGPKGFFIEWSANITNWAPEGKWGEKLGAMHFEGNAAFNGVTLRVKQEGDETRIIPKVFGTTMDRWNKYWQRTVLIDTVICNSTDPSLADLNSRTVNSTIEEWDSAWKKTVRRERVVYRNDPLTRKQLSPNTTWYEINYVPK
jgi:hypothetical protein